MPLLIDTVEQSLDRRILALAITLVDAELHVST